MKFTFSKPPPLNKLYGTNKWGAKYIKADGRIWKESVMWSLKKEKLENWDCPIALQIDLYTCRHQDNDSILKLLQDTLQEAGVFTDDYWVFDLRVIKHKCKIADERLEINVDKTHL